MKHDLTRRDFLAASAAVGAGLMTAGRLDAAPFKTTLKKALIGAPTEETLSSWKAAGFDGMETNKWDVIPADAAKGRKIAEKLGMPIHAVMRGWANFNKEPGTVAKEVESVETALRAAQAYGADALERARPRSRFPDPGPKDLHV